MADTAERTPEEVLRARLHRLGAAMEGSVRADPEPALARTDAPAPRRWRPALAAAAIVLLVAAGAFAVVLAARGGETPAREQRKGDQDRGGTSSSSTVLGTPVLTDGVSDAEGNLVGTYDVVARELRDQRILALQDRLGTVVDGTSIPYQPTPEEAEALLVVEALPVTGPSGRVTGYFSSHFIPLDDYPAELARAHALVDRLGEGD